MPSLDDLKKRIGSVKSTQKITKAMKMVAAAKLRRAQESAESSRPYSETMEDLISSISSGYSPTSNERNLLTGDNKDSIHMLILFTSERGLCGGFNSIVTKSLRDKVASLEESGKQVKIICVGKKGYDIIKRQHEEKIVEVVDMLVNFHHRLQTKISCNYTHYTMYMQIHIDLDLLHVLVQH